MKNIIIALLVIGIIILLLLQKCGGGGIVESVKIDTVYKLVKADTFYIPKTDTTIIETTKYKLREVITDRFDTLYLPELQDVDTLRILAEFYKSNIYKDTIKNDYGYIALTDTINQNKIAGRSASTRLSIPEITKTITLIDKRNQVYLGGGIWGSQKDFLSGIELNLSLKTKQDRIVGLGYQNLFNAGSFYKLEYRHKISFKKK
jgi:hypothetical protein